MQIKIDLPLCQGHGICEVEAPLVFRLVEVAGAYDHVELILESPPEDLREKVEAAVRYCPNRVLSHSDD